MKLRRRAVPALLLALAAPAAWLPAPEAQAARVSESARHRTLIRRAELKRNPFLGTAAELELRTLLESSGSTLRASRYLMITHRDDRTLVLLRGTAPATPAALLLDGGQALLLPAEAASPIALPMASVRAGDLSHLGFLRVNLRLQHEIRLVRPEPLGETDCWYLELESQREDLPFRRVRYWMERESLRPLRLDYADAEGRLLKSVRILEWQELPIGEAPLRMEILDAAAPGERTLVRLSGPERVPTRDAVFDEGALLHLREWAKRHVGERSPEALSFVQELLARAEEGREGP